MTDVDHRAVRRMADMHAVYRMFDPSGRLLYVGVTGNIAARLGDHAEKRWFPLVTTISLEWFPTRADAASAERRAIETECPMLNKAGQYSPPRVTRTKAKNAAAIAAAKLRASPRLTIKEAVAEGISGPTVDAVRKALQRDPGSPVPVGRQGNADTYDRVKWCDWAEARRQPRRVAR
jgi:predicted GIY-YIG superfamily endonuclease